jgi:hypothetical protein
MGESVVWNDEAKTQLRAIDRNTALRILYALARYLETGEGDVNGSRVSSRRNSASE